MRGSAPVTMPWLDDVQAVLQAWYPGASGGEAIARVLFGEVNPSGRLPISFPRAVADLEGGCGWLGIVRHDGLQVERIDLAAGRLAYVATYEENSIRAEQGDGFPATTAEEAADHLLTGGVFAQRENPVTAVAVLAGPDGAFEIFAKDAAL